MILCPQARPLGERLQKPGEMWHVCEKARNIRVPCRQRKTQGGERYFYTGQPGLQQAGSVVLLQTLTATIAGATTSVRYRVLFDGGSQRSFRISTANASERLGCKPLGEETLTIGTFGGEHTWKTMKRVRVLILAANKDRPISIKVLKWALYAVKNYSSFRRKSYKGDE